MAQMPAQYYSRFDPAKNYDEHLFIAGRGLQSAELNEIQKQAAFRLRGVADAIFKDGDVIRDASIVVDVDTGVVKCQPGAIYIRGAVRGLAPATFTIPTIGVIAVGVRLVEEVITQLGDPALRDPATGTRNYNEPGAERLRVTPVWAWDSDGGTAEFFPVYEVENGILRPKERPPNLDSVTQALARYDRDSAGGSYIVSGLMLKQLDDVGANQVYSLSEGRARVFGYGVEFTTSHRLVHAAVPDLKVIVNEPHLSTTIGAQRVNFDRTPGTAITSVSITAEKTVTLTHGVSTGAQDPLPDTSVLQIIEVKQGAVTFTPTTDYLLTAGKVDWSPAGAEPAPGSTYTVKYQYITLATPTAVDDNGFTVSGAVVGSLVLVSYSQKLPRYDRLGLSADGELIWFTGVASDSWPQLPTVPQDILPIASVYQTWTADRRVINDGVRVVAMPQLAAIEGRMDHLAQLIAQNRLESNIHTREAGTKKGLFTDPFLDESQRDAGTPQTAAIVDGELVLPISATISYVNADVPAPAAIAYTNAITLEQTLRTGGMKINPYMAFEPVPARVTLVPNVDRWTVVQTTWASPTTSRFVTFMYGAPRVPVTSSTRNVLLSTVRSNIETLRQITVTYTLDGFVPGESLSALTFDGISLPTGGVTANGSGVVTGSFTIPAGVPSGNKAVRFQGAGGSQGSAIFSGQGTLERQTWQQQTTITEIRWRSPPPPPPPTPQPRDPLAQTFTLPASTQLSGVDLWFTAASTTTTRVQIRGTATGFPTQEVLAEKAIQPNQIAAPGTHTRILFDSPVHLIAGIEYALVVLCDDATGELAVAEMGKYDVNAQRWITSQPYTIGVLLSSSNASTWTPHQDRDLAFRLLSASYTATSRNVSLGNVAVTAATDLLLMSYAERPASGTTVDYLLTLPDSSVLTVSDGEPIQLPAPITGDVGVTARLGGSAQFSPVLFPGTQIVAGQVANTADYVTRAIPAGTNVTLKVIFEAVVPSGATIQVFRKGPDVGDTWVEVNVLSNSPADDGFTEFIYQQTGITEQTLQIKLVLNGTAAARPRVRDLRVIIS